LPRKLSNIELNRLTPEQFRQAEKMPVTLVLDNIRSQHNIGAAFRTGDAFRIEKIILCGICAVPPGAEIHKAALGAEDAVSWEYAADTAAALAALRRNGYTPVAIEQTENAIPLQQFTPDGGKKYALVFGNEVRGVQQAVVDACDCAIEIPQAGTKHSLNVSVSIGIVLWRFFNGEWKMENVS
jgi:tRNA G18 (ribose-2'-O)-methylase SpoU